MAFTTKKVVEASMVYLPTGRLWITIPVTALGIEPCASSAPEGRHISDGAWRTFLHWYGGGNARPDTSRTREEL
jgi:hypothetical protein